MNAAFKELKETLTSHFMELILKLYKKKENRVKQEEILSESLELNPFQSF